MIDYRVADCYGIIVDCDFREKFEELLIEDGNYDDWEWEDISNTYCPYLNTWENDECFFGLIRYFDEEIHELKNFSSSEEEVSQFFRLCNKFNLLNMVEWEPKRYIITFVS